MLLIMELNPLIPIGTKIKVDKSKIENILPNKIMDDLPQKIYGKIVDYKMTDGRGIGYVLMTENNIKIWIFTAELNEQTRKDYKIKDPIKSNSYIDISSLLEKYKLTYDLNGNRKIKTITNPINLINWLIFTLKDTF